MGLAPLAALHNVRLTVGQFRVAASLRWWSWSSSVLNVVAPLAALHDTRLAIER